MTTYSLPDRMMHKLTCGDLLRTMQSTMYGAIVQRTRENPLPPGWRYDLSFSESIGDESITITATLKPVHITPPEGKR